MSRLLTSLRTLHTKTMAPIERITLFKIPNEADLARVLEQYKVLAKTATKVRGITAYSCAIRVGRGQPFGGKGEDVGRNRDGY